MSVQDTVNAQGSRRVCGQSQYIGGSLSRCCRTAPRVKGVTLRLVRWPPWSPPHGRCSLVHHPVADTLHSALIAEVDEDKDGSLDYTEIMAEPLPEIKY